MKKKYFRHANFRLSFQQIIRFKTSDKKAKLIKIKPTDFNQRFNELLQYSVEKSHYSISTNDYPFR